MTENLTFWEEDAIAFAVSVTIDPGAPIAALTGGSVEVIAERAGTGVSVVGSGTVTGATEVTCGFVANALPAGLYLAQVAVTVSGTRQTVAEANLIVRRSLQPPT